jgi:putative membrane protein insertion efficiency factor
MKITQIPKNTLLAVIWVYQKTLSPDHGWFKARHPHGYCRFYPTCSEYAKEAVTKHGVLKGLWLSGKRLIRCHPWAEPKIDNVPNF